MPERVWIEPQEIGKFIRYMALAFCSWSKKKKGEDMVVDVETAISLGFLVAQRQPELTEACAEYWNFTRQDSADKFVDRMVDMYQQMKDVEE